jgi:hypothetical protein
MNSTGGGITRRWSGPRRRYSFLAVERRVRRRGRSTASRWADQSESTTTMTTKGGIVGRGGGLVIWEARL